MYFATFQIGSVGAISPAQRICLNVQIVSQILSCSPPVYFSNDIAVYDTLFLDIIQE